MANNRISTKLDDKALEKAINSCEVSNNILAVADIRLAIETYLTAIEGKTDRITDPVLIEAFTGQPAPPREEK